MITVCEQPSFLPEYVRNLCNTQIIKRLTICWHQYLVKFMIKHGINMPWDFHQTLYTCHLDLLITPLKLPVSVSCSLPRNESTVLLKLLHPKRNNQQCRYGCHQKKVKAFSIFKEDCSLSRNSTGGSGRAAAAAVATYIKSVDCKSFIVGFTFELEFSQL